MRHYRLWWIGSLINEQDLENTLDSLKSEGYLEDTKKFIHRYQTSPMN